MKAEPPGISFIAPPNHKVPLRLCDALEDRNVSLFVPQRFYRIYAHCAAGRDQTTAGGGEREDEHDEDVGEGVRRRDVDQQGLQDLCYGERSGQANDESDGELRHALREDQTHDVGAGRAQGHADADFLRALADRVRDHRVEPDRGEGERDGGEDGEQAAEDVVGPVVLLQLLVHGRQIADRQTVVDGLDLAAGGLLEGRGGDRCSGGDGHAGGGFEAIGNVDGRVALGSLVRIGDVGDDTDDGEPGLRDVLFINAEAAAEGICVVQDALRELAVDKDGERRGQARGGGEVAAGEN